MKAMVLKAFGGVENFFLGQVRKPEPGPGQVLVRVMAAGIDPIDLKTRRGAGMADAQARERPMILGWDLSGAVEKTGPGVKGFQPGDEVFGMVGFPGPGCAYAEYAAVRAGQLATKPENMTHVEAAAATQSPLTAWQALIETGRVQRGERVLIHGAAGGVGGFAVQIAHSLGCYVMATASGADADYVRGLGADEVADYRTERFEERFHDADFVLDTVGGENFERSLRVLRPNGTIVLLPSDRKAEADRAARAHHIRNYKHMLVHSDGEGMRRIAAMLADGSLCVRVAQVYPFAEIPRAHERLEAGGVRGKIVVCMEK